MGTLALVLCAVLSSAPEAGARKTQLKVEIKPEAAVLFVDGVKKGTGQKLIVLTLSPGKHRLKVVHKGDEHEEVVALKKGEVKTWQWAFEDDRMDRAAPKEDQPPPEGTAPEGATPQDDGATDGFGEDPDMR